MEKTAKEMTSDILSSLRDEDNPLGIIIEGYLEKCLEMAKKEARKEVLVFVQPHDCDVKGNIVECNYHTLCDMLSK
jgi:hypothetical protein